MSISNHINVYSVQIKSQPVVTYILIYLPNSPVYFEAKTTVCMNRSMLVLSWKPSPWTVNYLLKSRSWFLQYTCRPVREDYARSERRPWLTDQRWKRGWIGLHCGQECGIGGANGIWIIWEVDKLNLTNIFIERWGGLVCSRVHSWWPISPSPVLPIDRILLVRTRGHWQEYTRNIY